ncbi:MAG TPA: S8 family peptidase [Vicinamibacterales bacterium]|nr:S8 family peptidase [Vicinamibacterales bacterium]
MKLRILSIWSLLAAGAAAGLFSVTSGAQSQADEPRFVANQVLVQFRADSTPQERANARARVNGQREEVIAAANRRRDGKGDLELLRIPPGLEVAAAARGLQAERAVEFAEPNWIYEHQATTSDPYYADGSLWGVYGPAQAGWTGPLNAFGSQADRAWAAGHVGLASVYVGVIDEGIGFDHPDLYLNVWTNAFDPVDGIDNDGNGYIDDVHGWDFDRDDNTVFDGSQDDHATHVAGTIGASGSNGIGVAGVNWNVTMISTKFLGRQGGTTANAVKAVDYITDLKHLHGLNIVATNNSWGGGGFSQALLDAINRGGDENILFVAAAGNGGRDGVGDNNDTTANYPSNYSCTSNGKSYDCVIAVAAITSSGGKASFSNYGATNVDLGAPGSGIYSTVPTKSGGWSWASYSGTSMATPHVTGAAALYASTHPGASAQQIKNAILSSTVPTPSLAGKTVTGGRLNVAGF